MILIDTNIVSEAMRPIPSSVVMAALRSNPIDGESAMRGQSKWISICAAIALVGAFVIEHPAAADTGSAGQVGKPLVGAGLMPQPDISPQRVVRIQLEALRHNDAQDRGIAIAFRFASPENKSSTGPLARFGRMIKAGPYALMLRFTDAAYDPMEIFDRRARQRVILIGERGAMVFVFYLSRQSSGDCVDCWMTDAVTAAPFHGGQARIDNGAASRET